MCWPVQSHLAGHDIVVHIWIAKSKSSEWKHKHLKRLTNSRNKKKWPKSVCYQKFSHVDYIQHLEKLWKSLSNKWFFFLSQLSTTWHPSSQKKKVCTLWICHDVSVCTFRLLLPLISWYEQRHDFKSSHQKNQSQINTPTLLALREEDWHIVFLNFQSF